jgi:hypothetical protein
MRSFIPAGRARRAVIFRRKGTIAIPAVVGILALGAVGAAAQDWSPDWCGEEHRGGRQHCEVREYTVQPADGRLAVNARPNGAIQVEGWNGSEIRVLARVLTRAEDVSAATRLAEEVHVRLDHGRIETDGPRFDRGRFREERSWSVSYRILVPRGTDLDLEALNGAIRVAGVEGGVSARTTNGAIRLSDVDGAVRVRTTNGSVGAEFSSDFRLVHPAELRTTNGSVSVTLPRAFSARLEASTTNGGITTDFPLMVQGRIGRRVSAVLGDGGPELRLATTNGGIRLRER